MTITLRTSDLAAVAILSLTLLAAWWVGEGLPNVLPSPEGPFLITAIVESGDTQHKAKIAKLRQRDENGWEHDFQVFDPDDCDPKYDTHPHPSLHLEPLGGGDVIQSFPFSVDVDEVVK